MAFISEVLGRSVTDVSGTFVGHVADLVAALSSGMPHPRIVAVVLRHGRATHLVSIADVAALIAPAVPLNKRLEDIVPYQPPQSDLFLARDVLDKQIIDTDGVRVVRVNDLELARVNGAFYVANVDVGSMGLLRRLGLGWMARSLAARSPRRGKSGVISWDQVELLPGNEPMRLKVPSEKIAELLPADLAEILADLSRSESNMLLESLDVKTVADTLEVVEPDFQASLVESMADEKVADVLEEMSPDEAADLLAELPEERSQQLLRLMEDTEAEDVRRLLPYREDTAGGIMTTDFLAIRPDLTADQAIAALRSIADETEMLHTIYIAESDNRLVGAVSLSSLVLAQPNARLADFMERRLVVVGPDDTQDKVAQAVAKYNLLAVPVVDEHGRIVGIVTADDALDKIIPTAWKKRLPRMYR